MKHIKEPWISRKPNEDSDYYYVDKDEYSTGMVATCYTEDAKYNAERIVACVNVMAGIEDPEQFMQVIKAALVMYEAHTALALFPKESE